MITCSNRLGSVTWLLLFFVVAPLHAQQQQSPSDRARLAFEARLSKVAKTMTDRVNAENADLNAHLTAINAANPLEKRNLDSVHVSENVSSILEFIDYLKHARVSSDTLARTYEDSLYVLAVLLPPDLNGHGIQAMDASFRTDRDAFNVFLDAMTKLYSDVLDVLLYLQHTPYSITNGDFTFAEKKDVREYQKRMKIVEADNKELNKANEDMRKANAKANQHTKNLNSDSDDN